MGKNNGQVPFGVGFEEEIPNPDLLPYSEITQTHETPLEEMNPLTSTASQPYETATGTIRDQDG